MDLFEETRKLLNGLAQRDAPYALAGAMALAVHGAPRATTDIDLLVPADALDLVIEVAQGLGFDLPVLPMSFSDGMEIQRLSKVHDDQLLTLDLLLVNQSLAAVWESRISITTDFGPVWVVSRSGLIEMKSWAGRDQDLADIRRLKDLDR